MSECIIWTGATSGRYGSLTVEKKRWYAHRFAYYKAFGNIPEGMDVCHRCDNPLCVNPDHLFIGTAKDNMQDCSKKGRLNHDGEHNGNRKLTVEGVCRIRDLHRISGMSSRKIAAVVGVHHTTVNDVVNGTSWKQW